MATNEDLMEQRLKTILWLYMYSSTTNLLGKELKPHCQHTELFLFIVQTQLPQQAQKTFLFHSVVPEHSLFGTSSHHCILSYSSPKENQKNMLYWVVCDKTTLFFCPKNNIEIIYTERKKIKQSTTCSCLNWIHPWPISQSELSHLQSLSIDESSWQKPCREIHEATLNRSWHTLQKVWLQWIIGILIVNGHTALKNCGAGGGGWNVVESPPITQAVLQKLLEDLSQLD